MNFILEFLLPVLSWIAAPLILSIPYYLILKKINTNLNKKYFVHLIFGCITCFVLSLLMGNWELNRSLGIPVFLDGVFYFSGLLIPPVLLFLILFSTIRWFMSTEGSKQNYYGHVSKHIVVNGERKFNEEVEKFKNIYKEKASEDLAEILTDKKYSDRAVEAARQILLERQ